MANRQHSLNFLCFGGGARRRALLLFFALAIPSLAHALVSVDRHPQSGHPVVTINGRIGAGDLETLKSWLNHISNSHETLHMNAVRLNTRGGDSTAAIELGKFIRSQRLNTFVGPKDTCTSACIYALIGGVTRMAYGTVYVHRFTYSDADISEADIRKEIKEDTETRRRFIADMGVSLLLAEAIDNTPHWGLRRLTDKELLHWNVHGTNHADEEVAARQAAKLSGIDWKNFYTFYVDNLAKCKNEAARFERLVMDCTVRLGKERAVAPRAIN